MGLSPFLSTQLVWAKSPSRNSSALKLRADNSGASENKGGELVSYLECYLIFLVKYMMQIIKLNSYFKSLCSSHGKLSVEKIGKCYRKI